MARTKEFDPGAALERAMELFWRQGYAGTSLAELVEHLGIGRASLYATFGSKHELYLAALRRYAESRDPSPIEVLAQPGPAIPAIRTLLDAYAAAPPADTPLGCMIANAAVETRADDAEVWRQLGSNWDGLEVALRSALLRARAQGELRADTDPATLAQLLLVLLQGMQVVGRVPGSRPRVRAAAAQANRMLDALR